MYRRGANDTCVECDMRYAFFLHERDVIVEFKMQASCVLRRQLKLRRPWAITFDARRGQLFEFPHHVFTSEAPRQSRMDVPSHLTCVDETVTLIRLIENLFATRREIVRKGEIDNIKIPDARFQFVCGVGGQLILANVIVQNCIHTKVELQSQQHISMPLNAIVHKMIPSFQKRCAKVADL